MSQMLSQESLSTLAADFTRRLSAARPPRVQITKGSHCSYSPFWHHISIGEEILKKASVNTCHAILAHEVGQALQPEYHRRARVLWALVASMLLACLPVLLVFLTDASGTTGDYLALSSLALIPVSSWLRGKYEKPLQRNPFELELEADKCATKLVGKQTTEGAYAEYQLLFSRRIPSQVGARRLDELIKPWHGDEIAKFEKAIVQLAS